MSKKMKFAAGLFSVLFLICAPAGSACAKEGGAGPGPSGKVTVAVSTLQTEYFDPIWGSNASGQNPLIWSISRGMVGAGWDYVGQQAPELATEWRMHPDRWEFTLRQGVKLQDGTEMTAQDVKYSYERAWHEKSNYVYRAELKGLIKEIVIVDPYHLVIHTTKPSPTFGAKFGGFPVVPKKYTEEAGEDFARRPLGAGPFKLVEQHPGEYYVLEAFEEYWNQESAPTVKTVIIKIIPEASVRLAALKKGEVDIAWGMVGPLRDGVEADRNLRVKINRDVGTCGAGFVAMAKDAPSPVKDVRVRKALLMAVDREGIIQALYGGAGDVPIHDGALGYFGVAPGLAPYPFDPEKAKQLMKEAGYPNGFQITLNTYENPVVPRLPDFCEVVASQWKEYLNVDCKVVVGEPGAQIAAFRAREMEGALTLCLPALSSPPDVSMAWFVFNSDHQKMPYSTCSFPEGDALYEKSQSEMDPEKRKQILEELSQFMYDNCTRLWLVAGSMVFGVGPRIAEWKQWPGAAHVGQFETIRLKK